MFKGLATLIAIGSLSALLVGQSRPSRPSPLPGPNLSSGKVIESFEQHRPASEFKAAEAQIQPPSRRFGLNVFTSAEHVQLSAPDQRELDRKVQRARRTDDRRVVVGIPRETSISPSTQGTWSQVSVQEPARVWALSFTSAEATAIRIHFHDFHLPAGTQLYVYSPALPDDVQVFEGSGPRDNGDFWSTIFAGDTVYFELLDPSGTAQSATLFTVSDVSHLFRDLVGPIGTAGACNLNAACYSAWSGSGDSVGRIAGTDYEGTFACSGTLISTQANDFTPFFLTATHCFGSDQTAQTAVVYWMYQTASCGSTNPPSIYTVPKTSGAALMNYYSPSDAALLYLTGSVPSDIPFAGWTTSDPAISASVTGIHHPRGSYRRISFGQRIADDNSYQGYHQVLWSSGVTEPGSSGSPIFNSLHQVLGQLSLGSSACSYPQGTDLYGKFSLNFDALNDTGNSNVLQQGTPDTDQFGSHQSRATAASLTLPLAQVHLAAKIGRDDWFRIHLPAGTWIKAHFVSQTRNYDISAAQINFYRNDDTSPTSLFSDTSGTSRYRNDGADADFYIQVHLYQGAYIPYDFSIDYGQPTPPSAELHNPIGRGLDWLYLEGAVDTGGMLTNVWWEYSSASDFSNSQTYNVGQVDANFYADAFKFSVYNFIQGFTASTTYYYRLHAQNSLGSAVSSTGTIRTLDYYRDGSFQPATGNFGAVVLGTTQTLWAYLQNQGTLSLAPTSATIGDDFSVSSDWNCNSYPNPGQTCYFPINFTPKTLGSHSATLVVTDHEKTYLFPVTANVILGAVANVQWDYSNQFRTVEVGQLFPLRLTVQASGSAPLVINSLQVGGSFQETSRQTTCPATIPVNSSCEITLNVSVGPTNCGSCIGTITMDTNAFVPTLFAQFVVYSQQHQVQPQRPARPTRLTPSGNSSVITGQKRMAAPAESPSERRKALPFRKRPETLDIN